LKVGVVGTGHVGLPTAAALAHIGHQVVAMDSDKAKMALMAAGEMPFYEPGLREIVQENVEAGRLVFSADLETLMEGVEVVFICVGTPTRESTGEANLLAIERAAGEVTEHATGSFVLVQKSTVPAGTGRRLVGVLERYRTDASFSIVANPEFLREGCAVEDSLHPPRILAGSDSPEALETVRRLYQPLIDGGARWIATDIQTAELAKHASNAFLALKISFANALAQICERADADVVAVADAMGADPRIGRSFLDAGLGYGGFCFPKDLAAFDALSTRLGYDFRLLREVVQINDEAVTSTYKKIEEAMWNLEEKRVALLGLSFKPNTSDTRFSPSLALAQMLLDAGAKVIGYDPQAGESAKRRIEALEIADDPYEALTGAHCAVIATDWDEFGSLDLAKTAELMRFPVIVDARNLLDPDAAEAAGFTYIPTGRPARRKSS
jgi:UDPglucose 6-dehydrogenase